jgi:Calx-beta domain/Domain of unknown function (DUF4114)/von Willebrand factor type D domain
LQNTGEFTLVKSTTDDFEIQTRQLKNSPASNFSFNSAFAIKTDGQRISVDTKAAQPLYINGTAVTLTDGALYAVGSALITKQNSSYTIFTANDDKIVFTGISVRVSLAANRQGKVVGLLGNDNGTKTDDFTLRDGTVIGDTITNQQLYGQYADSWRITQETSLFDYQAGKDTTTYTDKTIPQNIVTAATLTPEQRAAATKIAQDAGITDPNVLEDAILDITLSNNDPLFLQDAVEQQRLATVSGTNTLINPDGFSTNRWLASEAVIPYRIRFTNTAATGTTPIAQVTISEKLDRDLDLNTFSLSSFSFGSVNVTVPPGSQNFTQRLDLQSTKGVFVDVLAGLDKATGTVTWSLTAIDPTTGKPVDSATKGFLPPNDANNAGSGSVNYSVQPKANITSSTRIYAEATITFNNLPPVQTNSVFNSIDTDSPTSQVTALAVNNSPNFVVSWTGTDNGSGIATYDVYVSTDGIAYTIWQSKTDKTSATYIGEIGKTYSFYSVATDNIGRTEVKTAAAETTTKLVDPTPTVSLSITDADAAETLTGQPANPGQFTLTRTGVTTADLAVNYTLTGTATNGTDYQNLTGTATFKAGSDKATLDINPIDDNIDEGNETVILTLADGGTNYKLDPIQAGTLSIVDNETKPTISVANITQPEGNSGNTNYAFNLTLSNPSVETITVKYATADDTATAGSDYTAATSTVTFAPGETTKAVNVAVTGDELYEADESFKLNLSEAVNATISTSSATGTIVNDDLPVISLAVTDADAAEPANSGQFTLTRTGITTADLTVNYTLAGTATNGTDYQALTNTVTFKAGSSTATIDINTIDDNIYEGNETVILTLADNVAAYKLAEIKSGTVTIADDDTKPVISISDARPKFGKEGDPQAAHREFDITLSNPSVEAVKVEYATVDGTAVGGSDFEPIAPKTLTFAPGETTKTVSVGIIDDAIYEDTEFFKVKLTNSTNATIGKDQSTAKIIDDDLPGISIIVTDGEAAETKAGKPTNPGQFTFKRTGLTKDTLKVKYTIAGSATNGIDYKKVAETIVFAAGSDTATVNIKPIDDLFYEGTETVTLKLSTSEDYTIIGKKIGTVNIDDNDAKTPKLIEPAPHELEIEGGTGKSVLKFTKISQEGVGKDEVCAFVVDDEQGRIGGIAPGAAGYVAAALERAQVIFSNLGNNPKNLEFDRDSQRYLNFAPGERVQFALIADDTLDAVKANLAKGKTTAQVLFSKSEANPGSTSQAKFTVIPNDGGYEIAWEDNLKESAGKTNPDFNDLVLKVETLDNFKTPVGTGLQGKSEGSVIDLRSFAGQNLKVDTVSVSDAAYQNYIGFYAVEDAQGTLANGLKVGDAGYAEAAIKSAIMRGFKTETQSDLAVTGGKIFAPVVIANGTFEDFLNRNPQNQASSNIHAYFNYAGANTDKVDHFRLLGDNKFGVEDMYGGGDRDYNDIVCQLTVKS